ncbi:hypothetical protein RFH07_11705 [Acinetobacter seifertii]|uniref:hypothetical protein n=1 Tax=Acinetobacter seifertii TaxID=1530123 RepID=UPI00280CF2AB|nr:hypothetical protein [Acinetobacter seifertii]MDQ9037265.1 hypothetical protein [Acinetobacter seifertii]
MYTIRYIHGNKTHYVASDINGSLIVIEAKKSEFKMGHQISYDGKIVFNLTLYDETDAIIKLEGDEKKIFGYLLSIR